MPKKKIQLGDKATIIIGGVTGIAVGQIHHISSCDQFQIEEINKKPKAEERINIAHGEDDVTNIVDDPFGMRAAMEARLASSPPSVTENSPRLGDRCFHKFNGYSGIVTSTFYRLTGRVLYFLTPEKPKNKDDIGEYFDEDLLDASRMVRDPFGMGAAKIKRVAYKPDPGPMYAPIPSRTK